MEEYLNNENELTKKFFNLEEILAFQMKHDVQIIRGGDYSYCAYINGEGYSTALTPMYALVYGIKKWKEVNEGVQDLAEQKAAYVSGTLTMDDVERFIKEHKTVYINGPATKEDFDKFVSGLSEPAAYEKPYNEKLDFKQAIDEAVDEMLGINKVNSAAITMTYEARCKHCAMCKVSGKRSHKCTNEESERYNQRIALRDKCCSKFKLTN